MPRKPIPNGVCFSKKKNTINEDNPATAGLPPIYEN